MKKSIVISEADNIAALLENDRVVEFFVNRGELLLGDIYVAIVENILPGIDAAFVNLGKDKMGFLHANDIPGQGALRERLVPKQKLLVQITKEPTGHKGPRVSTAISLPGRFLVLVPEERGISISRRISESKERARLKSVVTLMKPPGVGVIIRTEAKGQNEAALFEDFETLWDRWQSIVSEGEASIGPKLIYRDQDLLYRVIRDAYSIDVTEIICDTEDGQRRASEFMSGWAGRSTKVICHSGEEPLLVTKGIDKDIEQVLSDRADLPSGGHLNIQPTEALTVIDVNSGRFTSSRTQAETVRKTNLEAAQEIPRQLRLRNIGGMVIVDFIDMDSRRDQQQVLEVFNRALEDDRAKPQVGQMSDLGLVELTRRRQGQSLRELFAETCSHCFGTGVLPTLALGHGDNKRIITLPGREEEQNKNKSGLVKRAGMARSNTPLRSASVDGDRIQSSLIEDFEPNETTQLYDTEYSANAESATDDEILSKNEVDSKEGTSQEASRNPRTIYRNRDRNSSYGSRKSIYPQNRYGNENNDENENKSEYESEYNQSINQVNPSQNQFAYSEDEEFHEDYSNKDSLDDFISSMKVVEPNIAVLDFPDSNLDEITSVNNLQREARLSEPESNFETEIDPVTGIYRLKNKSNAEQALESFEAEGNEIQLEIPFESNSTYSYSSKSNEQNYVEKDEIAEENYDSPEFSEKDDDDVHDLDEEKSENQDSEDGASSWSWTSN